jgi:2-dehydropantoate 2-reductase
MLVESGIEAVLSDNVQKEIWVKFLRLNTYAGMAALTRFPLGKALGDPDVREMALACMKETEAIARRKGIEFEEGTLEAMIADTQQGFSAVKPSMLLDLERGRKLELDIFQRTMVRMGEEMGVPTPVNRFIYTALKLIAEGTG